MSKHTEGDGVEKLKAVCKLGLEHLIPQKFRELKVPVPEPRLADGR